MNGRACRSDDDDDDDAAKPVVDSLSVQRDALEFDVAMQLFFHARVRLFPALRCFLFLSVTVLLNHP